MTRRRSQRPVIFTDFFFCSTSSPSVAFSLLFYIVERFTFWSFGATDATLAFPLLQKPSVSAVRLLLGLVVVVRVKRWALGVWEGVGKRR